MRERRLSGSRKISRVTFTLRQKLWALEAWARALECSRPVSTRREGREGAQLHADAASSIARDRFRRPGGGNRSSRPKTVICSARHYHVLPPFSLLRLGALLRADQPASVELFARVALSSDASKSSGAEGCSSAWICRIR
jgi:hypothetical protein